MVDGLDGCGKDTHASMISDMLRAIGHEVVVISHPSDKLLGRLTKRFLRASGKIARIGTTLFYTLEILMSVRWLKRQHEGTVIFVRYLMGTAYLPRRLAPLGYRLFRNLLPFPDLALFIDVEPIVAIERIRSRGDVQEMFETEEKLTAVRAVAKTLLSDEWVVVDNSENRENSFRQTEKVIGDWLASDVNP